MSAPDTAWHIMRLEINGASSKFFLDGSSEFPFAASPGGDGLSGLTLGAYNPGSGPAAFSQVTFAEVFIHAGVLSAGDETSAYSYLYTKWHDGSDSWVAP